MANNKKSKKTETPAVITEIPEAKAAEIDVPEKKNSKPKAEKKSASAAKKAAAVKAVKEEAVENKPAETKAVKPAEKKPAKKTAKAAAAKESLVIQSGENEYTMADIIEKCEKDHRGGRRLHIKSIQVYVKSDNNELRAYYVINGEANGKYVVL